MGNRFRSNFKKPRGVRQLKPSSMTDDELKRFLDNRAEIERREAQVVKISTVIEKSDTSTLNQ